MSLDPTRVSVKWHLNPSNGLSRVHECDRRQTRNRCRNRRNRLCRKKRFRLKGKYLVALTWRWWSRCSSDSLTVSSSIVSMADASRSSAIADVSRAELSRFIASRSDIIYTTNARLLIHAYYKTTVHNAHTNLNSTN